MKFEISSKKYFNEITLMKAFAVLFITWFHFKWSVPESLSPLFIGGSIGNSLFFFCSGYLLSIKVEKYPGQWLLKKYLRIMPSVWVTLCIIIVLSLFRTGSLLLEPLQEWLFPNQFWFVKAILIYFFVTYLAFIVYRIFYPGESMLGKDWIIGLIVLSLIVHVVYYIFFVNKDALVMDNSDIHCWFYWYAFFILGSYMKSWGGQVSYSKFSFIWCVLSIIIYFVYKVLSARYNILLQLQFILIPFFLWIIVYSFRKFAHCLLAIRLPKFLEKSIVFLSNVTLEVYLVQYYFILWLMPLIPFPVNIGVTFVVIFVVAYLTNVIAEKISYVRNYV